jgi:hypothetical protein
MTAETPIACTLGAGDYRARMAWIETLNRTSLRRHERDDLTLRLFYDSAARTDVEALVEQEQACCAFLEFQLSEAEGVVALVVSAPERARDAAEAIFAEFMTSAATGPAPTCGCC